MKPFLKWAGNKYQIIERIKEVLPKGKRLIEPFVGTGAVFLNTSYSQYILSDINEDLIQLYTYISQEGQNFIDYCKTFFIDVNNTAESFYYWRSVFNQTEDLRTKAALFVYLNKHGFNGLCRYNADGGFNVPFGKYTKPYFPEKEMQFFHQKSKYAVFKVADFLNTMNEALPGDVVYCDPPYIPLSKTANFTSYSSGGFTEIQQKELVKAAENLAQKGVPVIISNHNTEFVHRVYQNAQIHIFDVQRYISCNGLNRNKASEILAIFN